MRLGTKPIASPGRTEKFPPPLMRFLRSNGASKSTRRTSSSSFTRSSPMFIRKKHNNGEATQEPTSPKVDCMGQVRVKRSQKGMTKKNSSSNKWFSCWRRSKSKKKSLFFCNCCSSTSVIRSWFWCCCSSSQKVDEIVEVKKNEDELREKEEIVEDEDEEDEDDEEERKGFVNSTEAEASPPKNALFLMRCRSDPCKNSSMLSRFSDNSTNHGSHNTSIQVEEIEKPRLGNQEIDEEKVESCESSSSSSGSSGSSTIIKEEAVLVVGVDKEEEAGPLTLTRCKSEPTTSSSRLMKVDDDEIDHQKRNSEYNEKCPSHILL